MSTWTATPFWPGLPFVFGGCFAFGFGHVFGSGLGFRFRSVARCFLSAGDVQILDLFGVLTSAPAPVLACPVCSIHAGRPATVFC